MSKTKDRTPTTLKLVSLLRERYKVGELHRITRPGEVNAVLTALMGETGVVYKISGHPQT